MKKNKFDELNRMDLLKLVLEQEDELEKLRPKPAKFKLGQVLALVVSKHQWHPGQPAVYFSVLSVENRLGEWHYGYSRAGVSTFHAYPEKKLRALAQSEIDGSTPSVEQGQVQAQAVFTTQIPAGFTPMPGVTYTPNPAPTAWDETSDFES
jgi:hypothetical protein